VLAKIIGILLILAVLVHGLPEDVREGFGNININSSREFHNNLSASSQKLWDETRAREMAENRQICSESLWTFWYDMENYMSDMSDNRTCDGTPCDNT